MFSVHASVFLRSVDSAVVDESRTRTERSRVRVPSGVSGESSFLGDPHNKGQLH